MVHSEMPVVTSGHLHGFQLWVNLPAKDKMCKPRYQDYQVRLGGCEGGAWRELQMVGLG